MPFDCIPTAETPKRLLAVGDDLLGFAPSSRQAEPARPRPIPAWHSSRRPESIGSTLGVPARARQLIADEQRWCQGSFARTSLKIPVRVQSGTARHSARSERLCVLAMSLVCPPMMPASPWNGRRPGRSKTGTMIRGARTPM